MKKIFSTVMLTCLSIFAFSQLNMELLDQLDYTQNTNDIWGWVDPDDGTEYALVGTVTGVSVVSLADPENIVEVAFLPGASSTWRDIKTWGDYAYVINETSGGLMVIDLTTAPNNITATNWSPTLPNGLGTYTKSHNIYIDEFGYAYIAGANVNSGGMLIVDVFTTPGTPIFVAAAPAVYAHDVYVRDNLMYASQIYAGTLGIYDVSNKTNIPLLATQQTPFNFTHNAWLNDAGTVVFTTDEQANAPIGVYDISNLNNIVELDQFLPLATVGTGVIPHNVHVWQDWLIISYYTDGGLIVDASKPDNLIEVGNWDTFLGGNGGFSGAWGAYPFLPSGLVLLTDINNGLFVCGATYVRACWLEGTVTDATTQLPILGATIHIESTQANAGTTDLLGQYKTGQAIPGTFDVVYSAVGYYPKTVSVALENGVLSLVDVELEPLSSFSLVGQAVKTLDGSPVPGAQVFIVSDQSTYTAVSDASGIFTFPGIFGGEYTIYAGAWGYLHEVVNNFTVDNNTLPLVITLDKGYQDDFILDLGWTSSGTASSGAWVRGEPVGTVNNGQASNPDFDIDTDLGDQAYVTGNGGGGAGADDVDNGTVILTSPAMDLTTYNEPVLHYNSWFYNGGGNGTPNDALQIRVSNGTDEVVLETITQSGSDWHPATSWNLADFITLTNNVKVIFETSDLQSSGHLVEAAVDAFLVEDVSAYPPFSVSTTSGCSPMTVEFTDASDSTAVWAWSFEGGSPSTSDQQNPSVSYNTPGTYSVTLVAITNDGNTYTVNRPNFITVGAAPVAGFTASVNGAVANFANTSTNGGTYSWDFGDQGTGTGTNPSHTYANTGTYTVTLTVTNACGTDTYTQEVAIAAIAPTALFSVNNTQGCAPMTVAFSDLSNGSPTAWSWSFPGGTPATSTQQNPTVVYNAAGTYSVQLTASNDAGSSQVTQSQVIEVGTAPTAGFAYDLSINGSVVTVLFENNSTDDATYVWDFGDNTMSNETNPSHIYDAGQYDVTLTVTNDCGTTVYTETVDVPIVGTKELDETAYSLTASPNPFASETMVSYDFDQLPTDASLLIFNALGEQVGQVAIAGKKGSIAIGKEIETSGIYMLRLVVDGQVAKALRIAKM